MEVDDLSQAIEAYKKGRSTLDQFADWFRGVSRQKFAESVQVQQAILEIDSLFSRLDFEGLPEASFREELANAVHPFAFRTALVLFDERVRDCRVPLAAVAVLAIAFLNVQTLDRNAHRGYTSANTAVFGSPLNTGTAAPSSQLQPSVQAV
jgi:hypothetical protein